LEALCFALMVVNDIFGDILVSAHIIIFPLYFTLIVSV
jgi:hypothetical protein